MQRLPRIKPAAVSPVALIHQEGALGLVAVIGLSFREGGPLAALAPLDDPGRGIVTGAATAVGCGVFLWLIRALPPVRDLEAWQRRIFGGWTVADALAVALISGLAEEALMRALLQPIIGLVPSALLFAVLHLVPDRRLWAWPVMALGMGLALGVLFELYGYPAAAVAHLLLNVLALLRLRLPVAED